MIEIVIARNQYDPIGEVQACKPPGRGVQLIRIGDVYKIAGDVEQIRFACHHTFHQSIEVDPQMTVLAVAQPRLIAKPLLAVQITPAEVGERGQVKVGDMDKSHDKRPIDSSKAAV